MSLISSISLLAAQNIASYGFNKGLEKIFDSQEGFSQHLFNVINKAIEIFQKEYPSNDKNGKFAFYKSQVIIEEFLKYRLFASSQYNFDLAKIQIALKQNPNIIAPNEDQLNKFKTIFDELVKNDPLLKKLEIEAFYKDEIFEIKSIVEKLEHRINLSSIELLGKLETEYQAEINDLKEDLTNLKAKSALTKLEKLESRFQDNAIDISPTIWTSLFHLKACCLELIGQQSKRACEFHIKAYKKLPHNISYLDRACFSYYQLKDNKYERLKLLLEEDDEYNPVLWAVKVFETENYIEFIKDNIPSIALDNPRFKRLVFHHYINNSKNNINELINVLDFRKLFIDLPEKICYENFFYAVSIFNGISILFFNDNKIGYWKFIEKNDESLRFLNLSRLLTKSIGSGELDKNLNIIVFYSFWLEAELDCEQETLAKLEKSYKDLNTKELFNTTLYLTSLYKHNKIERIKSFLFNYTGNYDENLYSFKAYFELIHFKSTDAVFKYLSILKIIDRSNIDNVCSFLMSVPKLSPNSNIEQILNKLSYEKKSYKDLILLMCDTFSVKKNIVSISQIKTLEEDLNNDKSLYFYLAQIYYTNGYYKECSLLLESYVNEEEENRDLALFIYSLYSQKNENQIKLLELLKKWRNSFSFNPDFLNIELELRQILKDWEEIYHIALCGNKNLPNNESVFTNLILAISWLDKHEEIKNYIFKIRKFKFASTENILKIISVLLSYKYHKEALELLYKRSLHKSDSLARQNFFFISAIIPKKYFKPYDIVKKGRYVKLEIDQEKKIYFIDDIAIKNYPIIKQSIGKKVGETYTYTVGLNNKLINVKIVSVMNKYLALNDEIMEEALSPFSSMEMEPVKIDGLDKDSINKALINNFGGIHESLKKQKEENLNKYYKYNISFTEIVNGNYKSSYFDGYYDLVSNVNNGFVIIPLRYLPAFNNTKKYRYVIDFSSGLLMFDLFERYDLKFEKFIISQSLLHLIDNLIRETELNKKDTLSISIEYDKVIPHFIPKDFYKNRLKRLLKIKEWFQNNAEVIVPKEKLELMRQLLDDDVPDTVLMEYLIDNTILAQYENHILVSDDLIFRKHLKAANTSCSSEMFLKMNFIERQDDLTTFMLERRYIGLTLNAEILYRCYIEQHKEGKSHIFKYVLRNLSIKENYQLNNLNIVVQFLKKVALSSSISQEKYRIDATTIFVSLITGMDEILHILKLKSLIYEEFKLTGEYVDISLNCLLDAMKILNISNKQDI